MSPVYKSVIHTGDFVAFWERDDKLWVFSPGWLRQKNFYVEMEDWRASRTSYGAEDLARYEDVVNAAWHYCGQSFEFLDRERATLSVIEQPTPLNLGHWAVCLSDYRDLGEFTPFKTWNVRQPTRSLPWYESYNATKHHRDAKFSKASLLNLLNAMCALHIMSAAQWGPASYPPRGTFSPSTFTITMAPKIPLCEVYMPSIDGKGTLTSRMYFES